MFYARRRHPAADGWPADFEITALRDSISVYIEPSLRERKKWKKIDERTKYHPNSNYPAQLLQVLVSNLEGRLALKVTGHFGPKPSRPLDTSAPSHLGPKPSRPHLKIISWTLRPLVSSAPSHLGPIAIVTSAPV